MTWRILVTLGLLIFWSAVVFVFNTEATLIAGKAAGTQFQPSDGAFLHSTSVIRVVSGINGVLSLIGLLILAAIWWVPGRNLVSTLMSGLAAAVFGLIFLQPLPANAYYDKSDYTENYFILPNESAFYIPDVGNNKDDQAKFGSEAYLSANKIPAKRFNIPHVKLENSGLWSNFYVPAGRLIIVDRTPYSREWVDAHDRGTSNKKEGFPCQSKEGLDITVGIAIGSSVSEDNSAKFLYNFGVLPPKGDRADPVIIFTSVYYGRSLTQVMDGPVRNKIQSLVCNELAGRTLDEANAKAVEMMTNIEKATKAYLDGNGITLSYIGWSDTFTFDGKVQDAINRRYAADKEAQIAGMLGPHTSTLQALANAEAVRTAAAKWDGKVPQSVSLWWFPSDLAGLVGGLFNGKK